MDAAITNQLDRKVLSTLEHCIAKIADVLSKTFDINSHASITLFKFFCSSIKTRMTFIKSISKQGDKTIAKIENLKKIVSSKPVAKPDIESVLSFTPPKKTGKEYQHPIRPQDLQSGLLIKK